MKQRKILALLGLTISLALGAQTQQGYVKTKGRLGSNGTVIHGTPLGGATVTVKGRNAVVSGNNGKFSLTIPGNSYYLQNVQKQGYVLTDPDVLSKQYVQSKNVLTLVMEDKEQQEGDKLDALRKIRRTLQRQLEKKEDEIEALKTENKLTLQEYQQRLQQLYDEQKGNEQLISDMAERYSKIDYDQVDEFNRRISDYILKGELTKADSLLNSRGDLNTQVAVQKAKGLALKTEKEKIEKAESVHQRENIDLASRCYSKFEIFKMQHRNDSAAYYIRLRADIDTTRTDWSLEAGKFYQKYMAQYQEAEKLFCRSYRRAIMSGTDCHSLLLCVEALASIYASKGDLNKSLEYYQKGYEMCLEHREEYSQDDIITVILNLANNYRRQGQFDKAQEWSEKALDAMNKAEELPLSTKAKAYGVVADIYSAQHMPQKALELYEKTYTLLEPNKNSYPLETITTYSNLGNTYYEIGNYDAALEWDNKSIELIKTVLGDSHPEMAAVLNNMGTVYIKQKKADKAIECLTQTVLIDKKTYGQYSPILIVSYNNLGKTYEFSGNYNDALSYYHMSLDLCKKTLPDDHPHYATLYNNIGSLYVSSSQSEDLALEYFNKALQLRIKKFGEINSSVAFVYNNIAKTYNKKGDVENAIIYYEKAKTIFEKTLGPDHPNTKVVAKNLNIVMEKKQATNK